MKQKTAAEVAAGDAPALSSVAEPTKAGMGEVVLAPVGKDGLVKVVLATDWEDWKAGAKLKVDPVRAKEMLKQGVLAGKGE